MIEQLFNFLNGLTQQFRKGLLRVRIVRSCSRDTGFDDVGFVAGFLFTPVFQWLPLAHPADFIYATGFSYFNTDHMLIQQFFHLIGVFVVVDLLTGILLSQLAQAGELFHRFFVVAAIFIAKALVFKGS